MNKLRLSIGLCLFLGLVGVTAQKTEKISVRAVSHTIQEHDYKTLQPLTENASCGVYEGTVYCSDSTMHAHYDEHAWWLFEHLKLLFAAIGGMLSVVLRFLEFLGATAIVVLGVPVVVYLALWLTLRRQQRVAPSPQPLHAPKLPEKHVVCRDPWHENWAKDDPVGYSEGYQKDLNAYLGRARQVLRTRFRNSSATLKGDTRYWATERGREEYIAMEHYQRDIEVLCQQSPASLPKHQGTLLSHP